MLINKTDISNHRELSRTVTDKKINPYIEDAEFLDLKPLLGETFYNYIIANQTDEKVVKLLSGDIYTHNDNNYAYVGLKKVLSIFTNARFVLHGSFTPTGYGMVEKQSSDSTPVSGTSKRDIYQKDREVAYQYWNEIERFLNRKKADFPQWKSSCTSAPRNTIRISKISHERSIDSQHPDLRTNSIKQAKRYLDDLRS